MEKDLAALIAHIAKVKGEKVPVYDGYMIPKFPRLMQDTAKQMKALQDFDSRDTDILLCAFPKSGTNWVYEIVKMLLRGNSEYDTKFKISVMMECIDISALDDLESPRFLNTHIPFRHIPKKHVENGYKIIRVLRNPKDVMVSFYNHYKKDPFLASPERFSGSWDDFFKDQLNNVHNFNDGFFNYELDWEDAVKKKKVKNVFMVFYEDLKRNPVEEIVRLGKFLEVTASDELVAEIADKCSFQKLANSPKAKEQAELIKAISEDGSNFLFRKGTIGDWKNWFTVAQNEQFDEFYAKKMKDSELKFTYDF